MPDTIDQAFIDTYNSTWYHLAQQRNQRLAMYVDMDNFQGERKRYNTTSEMNWSKVPFANRKDATVITDLPTGFRWAYNDGYDIATDRGEWDDTLLGTVVSPQSPGIQAFAFGYNRLMDRVVIDAGLGIAKSGDQGTTDSALPASQKVAAGGTGLTLAKILTTKEILDDSNDVDDDDPEFPRVWVCTARQITNLLNTTEVRSADYNTVKALAEGRIDTFCGFKFKKIKSLPVFQADGVTPRVGAIQATDIRRNLVMIKGGVTVNKADSRTKITEHNELRGKILIRASCRAGAVRVEDSRVVQVDCVHG